MKKILWGLIVVILLVVGAVTYLMSAYPSAGSVPNITVEGTA